MMLFATYAVTIFRYRRADAYSLGVTVEVIVARKVIHFNMSLPVLMGDTTNPQARLRLPPIRRVER
jgi:hypothetical protein